MGSVIYFILPGPPETPTGGFVYDRHVLRALRAAGRLDGLLVFAGDWPEPGASTRDAAALALAALPDGATVIVDGLGFSPLLEVFAAEAERLALLALIHHPLADETGAPAALRERLFARERSALALVRGVLVTSAHTAERLAAFGVPAARIRVVRPGIATPRPRPLPRPLSRHVGTAPREGEPLLLSVASLTPRKGQDILLRAMIGLRRRRWRLLLAGPALDRSFAGRLRRLARALRLGRRVRFAGEVDPGMLATLYTAADLFVFPSWYEGYGIAAAEAAAHGLPIVASDAGALAEATAGAHRRLVPPGRPAPLATAIRTALAREVTAKRRDRPKVRPWPQVGREFVAAVDDLTSSFDR